MPSAAPVEPTPRPRSPARSEAARRNGARSRGPVTAEGKARASRNALRHGLCSTRSLAPGEDPEAFATLLADLCCEAAPRSRLEALLLERLALTFWKARPPRPARGHAGCDRAALPHGPAVPRPGPAPDPLPRAGALRPRPLTGPARPRAAATLELVSDPLLDRLAETAAAASRNEPEPARPSAPAAETAPAALRNEPEPARPRAPPRPLRERTDRHDRRRAGAGEPLVQMRLIQ
jgi:hypothetical protein